MVVVVLFIHFSLTYIYFQSVNMTPILQWLKPMQELARQAGIEVNDRRLRNDNCSVLFSISVFNMLCQRITRTQLSQPPWFSAHTNTHTHLLDSNSLLFAGLSCYCVPVSCTEDAFVFQSQSVETRGCLREEEKSRIKEG